MGEIEIDELKAEIAELRKLLQSKEEKLVKLLAGKKRNENVQLSEVPRWAIERYSRQALLRELGPPKENILRLMQSSVLVVGAGGLGCPVSVYLAGAGIGHIGIVDYDDVELTNLHRQPLHSESTLGMSKVESAALFLRRLNSNVKVSPYKLQLDSSNALLIINQYDVVVDATDNVVTRYLLNDACVFAKKPLVSAAALQLSGQLTVYNYKITEGNDTVDDGPCFRCLFPKPPPPETVGTCSQNGVLGPVPGVMGCLQAVEVVKIILGRKSMAGSLLLYDGADCTFTKVKLRGKNPNCPICSDNPTITDLIDYEQFCNSLASDKELKLDVLKDDERIEARDFDSVIYRRIGAPDEDVNKFGSIALIDVRSRGEFEMCRMKQSKNCPIDGINYSTLATSLIESNTEEVYFVCRRGNDSQIAVRRLKNSWPDGVPPPVIKDIEGGLHAWGRTIDPEFPIY